MIKIDLLTKNLQYLLDHKIITANKLLEITGHNSTGLVAMWKNGDRTMRTEDILKLANYLDLTIDDLINTDLSKNKESSDEFEILFDKHKDILTDDDKEYIKFIFEKRKKEIEKEKGINND